MSYYEDQQQQAKMAAGMMSVASGLEVRTREIIPNLKAQRQELVNRVQKIDTLLAVLEKNPDFARMFDLARELV